MPRSVMFSVVERKNPSLKNAPIKYYAQAQASGDVDSDEMATRIEKNCTVTRADMAAVLTALEDTIVEGLEKGEIVRLGKLGSFQIGLNGKGADTEKDFSTTLITKAKINFRPGTALSKILTGLSYTRVSKLANRSGESDSDKPVDPSEPTDPTDSDKPVDPTA